MNNIFFKPTDKWWSAVYDSNDANSILDTGIGLTTSGFANVPDDGWGTLLSFVFSESYRIQIIHTWNYNKIYIRACYDENWTEWNQIG